MQHANDRSKWRSTALRTEWEPWALLTERQGETVMRKESQSAVQVRCVRDARGGSVVASRVATLGASYSNSRLSHIRQHFYSSMQVMIYTGGSRRAVSGPKLSKAGEVAEHVHWLAETRCMSLVLSKVLSQTLYWELVIISTWIQK